jgi:uncharacterized iron-regulated membrane protein
MKTASSDAAVRASHYRTIWRWHFYASLFVIPFILILSLTGAVYLFKPQLDRWEERAYRDLPATQSVGPNEQVEAVVAAFPKATIHSFRLPERAADAAMVHIEHYGGQGTRDVFVAPDGAILGSRDPDWKISRTLSRIHGSLLLPGPGDWLVELAAGWAIVMVLTGLYLWWPSGRGFAGMLWPRRRSFLRDLHAVTGFWISGLALLLLFTGLPWSNVWGDAFQWTREQMGWVKGDRGWSNGSETLVSRSRDGLGHAAPSQGGATLSDIVKKAEAEKLEWPVRVFIPGASDSNGPGDASLWVVKSETQNRPLRVTVKYRVGSGERIVREDDADKHVIDRVVGYGIAWHEGQLFGWVNQLVGVLTALALITLSITGFLMWRKRKPGHGLGAPPASATPKKARGAVIIALTMAAIMPLFAASLILLWLFEKLVLRRLPNLSTWLGVRPA